MTADLLASLLKFAASDLRSARKNGDMMISQTQRGTLTLRHDGGVYTLSTCGIDSEVLATGKPFAVKPVLARLYSIA